MIVDLWVDPRLGIQNKTEQDLCWPNYFKAHTSDTSVRNVSLLSNYFPHFLYFMYVRHHKGTPGRYYCTSLSSSTAGYTKRDHTTDTVMRNVRLLSYYLPPFLYFMHPHQLQGRPDKYGFFVRSARPDLTENQINYMHTNLMVSA